MVKLYINAINYFQINYFENLLIGKHEAKRIIETFPEVIHIEIENPQTGETLAEFARIG